MAVETATRPWVGRALARHEDARFTSGRALYVDDVRLPGVLHAAFVRSPYPHAEVAGIDADAARAVEGVRLVLTAADIEEDVDAFPILTPDGVRAVPVAHPVLAGSRVRYVGQAVAIVVAESSAQAVDAAESVLVEYEELEPVLEPGERSPTLHEEAPDNVLLRWRHAEGDVEQAFARAHAVVSARVRMPRLIASPLEARGVLAERDVPSDVLTVWTSAQDQHRQLAGLSAVLRRGPDRLRVVVPDVGGAFGSKGVPSAETAAVALAALRLDRPVKWIETRTENALASYQGRGAEIDAELALDASGRMLALRARYVTDVGAYLYSTTPVPPLTGAKLLTGCYAIPAADVELVGVASTRVPTGPYRGAGRPEAAFVVERLVDLAARKLDLDPVELRRRNLVPSDAFPYRTPLGFTYDSGDFEGALDLALELAEPGAADRTPTPGVAIGTGIAMYVERVGPGGEYGAVRIEDGGRVVCRTGSVPHGQGHETTFAQIVADELGIDVGSIEVRFGDSAEVPRGGGTFASRSVTVGGSALLLAARELRERLERGEEPPLEAEAFFELSGPAFSSGAYVVVVEVETETGVVTPLEIVAVDDCGRVVNPLLAEGQVLGAIVQALGECLTEQVGYDDAGQPLAVNLYEYRLPTAASLPRVVTALRETPSPLNPLGAKGIGEGGSIGTPAALANAVCDALAPLGVRHLDPPFTPSRVWEALRSAAEPGLTDPHTPARPPGHPDGRGTASPPPPAL